MNSSSAPYHTAKKITAWLENHKMNAIKWPSNLPDLNPIENVWVEMKRQLES